MKKSLLLLLASILPLAACNQTPPSSESSSFSSSSQSLPSSESSLEPSSISSSGPEVKALPISVSNGLYKEEDKTILISGEKTIYVNLDKAYASVEVEADPDDDTKLKYLVNYGKDSVDIRLIGIKEAHIKITASDDETAVYVVEFTVKLFARPTFKKADFGPLYGTFLADGKTVTISEEGIQVGSDALVPTAITTLSYGEENAKEQLLTVVCDQSWNDALYHAHLTLGEKKILTIEKQEKNGAWSAYVEEAYPALDSFAGAFKNKETGISYLFSPRQFHDDTDLYYSVYEFDLKEGYSRPAAFGLRSYVSIDASGNATTKIDCVNRSDGVVTDWGLTPLKSGELVSGTNVLFSYDKEAIANSFLTEDGSTYTFHYNKSDGHLLGGKKGQDESDFGVGSLVHDEQGYHWMFRNQKDPSLNMDFYMDGSGIRFNIGETSHRASFEATQLKDDEVSDQIVQRIYTINGASFEIVRENGILYAVMAKLIRNEITVDVTRSGGAIHYVFILGGPYVYLARYCRGVLYPEEEATRNHKVRCYCESLFDEWLFQGHAETVLYSSSIQEGTKHIDIDAKTKTAHFGVSDYPISYVHRDGLSRPEVHFDDVTLFEDKPDIGAFKATRGENSFLYVRSTQLERLVGKWKTSAGAEIISISSDGFGLSYDGNPERYDLVIREGNDNGEQIGMRFITEEGDKDIAYIALDDDVGGIDLYKEGDDGSLIYVRSLSKITD